MTLLVALGEPTAAAPVLTPGSGTYAAAQTVSMSSATPGASIYYTTDGSTPTTTSTLYTAPITVSATETVKAIAAATNYLTSAVASDAYIIGTGANTLTVLAPSQLPAGGVGVGYQQSYAIVGSPSPTSVTWTLTGTLATWLTPSTAPDGTSVVLAGTPTTVGTYSGSLQGTDVNGNYGVKTVTCTVPA
ncbi:MAG: chitobiase/beta-hexosaminidase C-terminal domain-containing protein [Patescibacteria group bacterium]|nr:chitobiase/beta-hexosaminidase C-terminal domain-containing protein [Patescibacteria group bacterium]